jgi:CO/xanthine dehydrogenase Mo-binding subunit
MSALTQPLDRREFLKGLGAGLLVCLTHGGVMAQESGRTFGGHALPKEVSAWIHIGADGNVTVYTGKVEVGQNIRTSLAQQVAEELRVPFSRIAMVMGDTDLVPWDMGTFGSRTTPTMGPELRMMAAAARVELLRKAAAQWKVSVTDLKAEDGRIVGVKSGRSASYGELTRGEKLVSVVEGQETLTPATEWRVAGTPVRKVEIRAFVTGEHKYPSDVVRPGMLFGAVVRPAGFNAKLISVDTSAAEKMPGVQIVREGDFIGVVAPAMYTAQQAVEAIHAKWEVPVQPSNDGLFEYLKSHPDEESRPEHQAGSVEEAMAAADVKVEDKYTVQYIAHAPLEPRAAVAEWNEGKVTVWTGTQRPFGVRDQLMEAFSLPVEKVRVLQPDMGSGYGGKHTGEAALEAARLSKAAGRPVKVVWSREDEFTWAYLRPAGLMELRAAARRDGTLVAWEHHNYNSGPAAISTPYVVGNQLIQYHAAQSPLRQGSYRSLAATANNFARESHMDAVAHAVGMDPVAFRLKNLADPRLIAVVKAATERFGWEKARSTPTSGYGFACGNDKGGYVAACAEVEIDGDKRVRIRRIVQAWESGAIINPDGLRNQVGGAIVQGIGGALFEAILFGNGRILNPHFADYRLPRFRDVPEIDVVLVDRKDLPSAGAGESGLICVAPAVGNALFAATGQRLRNMPMAPDRAVPGVAASGLKS